VLIPIRKRHPTIVRSSLAAKVFAASYPICRGGHVGETSIDELTKKIWTERAGAWQTAMTSAQHFVGEVAKQAIGPGADASRLDCSKSRIKESSRAADKIRRKLSEGKLATEPTSPEEVESAISDILGIKVLCKSMRDLTAFIDCLVTACEESDHFQFAEEPVDYTQNPKESGYRAFHAVIHAPTTFGAKAHTVKVEIQAKTRLQDAWGELTHEDMYKPGEALKPSAFHKKLAKVMADMLSAVDQLADDLALELETLMSLGSTTADEPRETHPATDHECRMKVKVVRTLPNYALAADSNSQRGLIPALVVRNLLVEEGRIETGEFIDVDDYLAVGDELDVVVVEADDALIFHPEALPPASK
jgi:putative GTP pyrophosphokinase